MTNNNNYFIYSIAGDGWSTDAISTTKIDEDTLTDILWDCAPDRCNVCGEVEDYEDSLKDVLEFVNANYAGETFYISEAHCDGKVKPQWAEVYRRVEALFTTV